MFLFVSFSNAVSDLVVDTLKYFRLRERGCCCRGTLTISFIPYLIGHRPCLGRLWRPSKGQSLLAAAGSIAECSSRVKADILFSYQLPVNLVALCIMLPASYILSPRWFHKVKALKHDFISSDRHLFSGQRLHDKVRVLSHNGNRDEYKYTFKG